MSLPQPKCFLLPPPLFPTHFPFLREGWIWMRHGYQDVKMGCDHLSIRQRSYNNNKWMGSPKGRNLGRSSTLKKLFSAFPPGQNEHFSKLVNSAVITNAGNGGVCARRQEIDPKFHQPRPNSFPHPQIRGFFPRSPAICARPVGENAKAKQLHSFSFVSELAFFPVKGGGAIIAGFP